MYSHDWFYVKNNATGVWEIVFPETRIERKHRDMGEAIGAAHGRLASEVYWNIVNDNSNAKEVLTSSAPPATIGEMIEKERSAG